MPSRPFTSRVPLVHCTSPRMPLVHCTSPRVPLAHCTSPRVPLAHCTSPRVPLVHCTSPRVPLAHCTSPRVPLAHCSDVMRLRAEKCQHSGICHGFTLGHEIWCIILFLLYWYGACIVAVRGTLWLDKFACHILMCYQSG